MNTAADGNGWTLATRAVFRARLAIVSVAAVNTLAVIIGILMVHSGSEFALTYGDELVARAQKRDPPPFLTARAIGSPRPPKTLR